MIHRPLGLTSEEAMASGEVFGLEHGVTYDQQGKIQMDRFVRKLGGTVCILSNSHYDDLMYVYDENRFQVNLADNTSHRLDRFTIARALGHYELHFIRARATSADGVTPAQAIFEKNGLSEADREAHDFAVGLLLPTKVFRALYDRTHGEVSRMAEQTDLPVWLVEERLEMYATSQKKLA